MYVWKKGLKDIYKFSSVPKEYESYKQHWREISAILARNTAFLSRKRYSMTKYDKLMLKQRYLEIGFLAPQFAECNTAAVAGLSDVT